MRVVIMAILALATVSRTSAGQRAAALAQDSVLVGDVRRLITERVQSYFAGDSAKFDALIAPGYVHVNDSGARWSAEHTLRVIAMNRPDATTPAYHATVEEVVVRRVGSVVMADAGYTTW